MIEPYRFLFFFHANMASHPYSLPLRALHTPQSSVRISGGFTLQHESNAENEHFHDTFPLTNLPLLQPFLLHPPMGWHLAHIAAERAFSWLAKKFTKAPRMFAPLSSGCFPVWWSLQSMNKWMKNLIPEGYSLQLFTLQLFFGSLHILQMCGKSLRAATQERHQGAFFYLNNMIVMASSTECTLHSRAGKASLSAGFHHKLGKELFSPLTVDNLFGSAHKLAWYES